MWWLKNARQRAAQRIRIQSIGDILDEQTFWQIVRAEKERADRSGIPVTVAVFTVRQDAVDQNLLPGWNGAALCSLLRSTARRTDHVGLAGENELGVLLWGTRELGAYRFVRRLGAKAQTLASDCRLFVYPTADTLAAPPTDRNNDPQSRDDARPGGTSSADRTVDEVLSSCGQPVGEPQILNRISEVEQRLAQAMNVETPVVQEEDCPVLDDRFGFGTDAQHGRSDVRHSADGGGATATATQRAGRLLSSAPHFAAATSQTEFCAHEQIDNSSSDTSPSSAAAATEPTEMRVSLEQLESLFVVPHPAWKRCMDIVCAACGLVLLSPLLAAISVLIRLTSPGPVLFRQVREGYGGKLFTILKFRTMRVGADAEKAALRAESEQDGPAFKMKDDPRITPLGRFLRRTCLDELPQLWNVLTGDMTLVGPRPLDHRESGRIARWGRRRLMVMPGLTCIWQVHGKSRVSFNEWMRMDIRYAQRLSLVEDFKLMLATLKQVLLRQASQ